jgi:adenine-specific DNA methylase
MIKEFFQTFRKPSAQSIAVRELEDAKRDLLSAQSATEYAQSLSVYHAARIQRLTAYTKEPQ